MRPMIRARWKPLLFVVVTLSILGVAWADGVRTFVADTPALASDVNHNFVIVAPPGMITIYAGVGTTPPDGWLFCDGSSFSAATYPQLSAVLGASTTPDLRGRSVVGVDVSGLRIGSSQANTLGETGGSDVTTEVPSHSHSIAGEGGHSHTIKAACNSSTCGNGNDGFTRGNSNIDSSTFTTLGAGAHNHGGATGSTGLGSVPNLPPFMALRYIIKT